MSAARLCSIEECDRPVHARGWCLAHYQRHLRGAPLGGAIPRRSKLPLEEVERASFLRHVTVTPGCWLWTGSVKPNGYGKLSTSNRYPHRFAYELWVGPIPEGLTIDHLCNNRVCVNPAHLEPVTAVENTRRGVERRTHCRKGHSYEDAFWRVRPETGQLRRLCRECRRQFSQNHRDRVKASVAVAS